MRETRQHTSEAPSPSTIQRKGTTWLAWFGCIVVCSGGLAVQTAGCDAVSQVERQEETTRPDTTTAERTVGKEVPTRDRSLTEPPSPKDAGIQDVRKPPPDQKPDVPLPPDDNKPPENASPEQGPPTPTGCPPGVNGLNNGSGTIFGCAIRNNGTAVCLFPSNPKGVVTTIKYKGGQAVQNVRQVTGWGFTEEACVLLQTGSVHCGRVDPRGGNAGVSKTPVIAKDVLAISGGYEEMCALVKQPAGGANQVMCWTKNHGTDNLSAKPAKVGLDGQDRPIAISSRYKGNCVLLQAGTIKCWGSNSDGQLGRGTQAGDIQQPAATKPLAGKAICLAAGQSHTCAVLEGGKLQCWGATWAGQFGGPAGAPINAPGALSFNAGVAMVACGQFHTCALLTSGKVQCTGKISSSSQGNGWKDIAGINDAIAISAGKEYTCALRRNGQVQCWGNPSGGAQPVSLTIDNAPLIAMQPTCQP